MDTKRMIKRSTLSAVVFTSLVSTQVVAVDETFTKVCSDCHSGGFKGWVSGAPNVKKAYKWEGFLDRHNADEMKEIVLNGSKEHKRMGGCKTCTDNEVRDALDYMLTLVK